MYQVLHDTNNVTDSGCHCVSADHSFRVVGSGSVVSSSELFTVVRPSIWDKSSDMKTGQWGRPWLVWYVPCQRRCVPRFTKLKHRHRHRNDRRWRCETHSVGTQWQSVGEPHNAIFTVLDELSLESPIKWQYMCYYNPLHRSRRFINQFRLTDQNAKLFTRNHDMCFAEKSARMLPWCSHWSIACGVI